MYTIPYEIYTQMNGDLGIIYHYNTLPVRILCVRWPSELDGRFSAGTAGRWRRRSVPIANRLGDRFDARR